MSTIETYEDEYGLTRGVRRAEDILFSTVDPHVIGRLASAFLKGGTLHINMKAWVGEAFVIKLTSTVVNPTEFFARETRVDVVLRPTGAPGKRTFGSSPLKDMKNAINKALYHESQRILDQVYFGVDWATGNCRCAPVFIAKEKKMKVRNRFYAAAPHCTTASEQDQDNLPGKVTLATPLKASVDSRNVGGDSYGGRQTGRFSTGKWTRKTLDDAVNMAEQMLEAQPERDHVAIVQIVRIVRRKKAPITVEVVR